MIENLPAIDPTAPGLWRQMRRQPDSKASDGPALFLDRDGVLVEEVHYLHRVEDMRMIDGAADLIRSCNRTNIPAVLVTNQSGVGRGYYGWAQFAALQQALEAEFQQRDAELDLVLACAYHEDGRPPYDVPDHDWRKPNPGMLREAAALLNLDLSRSWIVGDALSDIEAGRNAGLKGAIHVRSGHGRRDLGSVQAVASASYPVRQVEDIASVRPMLRELFFEDSL